MNLFLTLTSGDLKWPLWNSLLNSKSYFFLASDPVFLILKWAGKKEIWFEPAIWSELLRRLGSLGQISSHNEISEPIEKLDFFGHLTDFSWGKNLAKWVWKMKILQKKIKQEIKKLYNYDLEDQIWSNKIKLYRHMI